MRNKLNTLLLLLSVVFLGVLLSVGSPVRGRVAAQSIIYETPDDMLPYDAEVEYLVGGGNRYINTGIIANLNMSMEVTAYIPPNDNTGAPLIGAGNANTSGPGAIALHRQTSSMRPVCLFGASGKVQTVRTPFVWGDSVRKLQLKGDGFYVDGVLVGTIAGRSDFSLGLQIQMFKVNGATTSSIDRYIYSAKIWDGEVLVGDYQPVRFTNAFGIKEGAMYDKVSKRLLRSAGSGEFIVGPDITPPDL